MEMPKKKCDPSKVICTGQGLSFGYINQPIESLVDTRQAGSGELTVFCDGPERKAFCELKDNKNGTFAIVLHAQDVGMHELHVQYDGHEVLDSPFSLRVSPAGLVRLSGPGLKDGLLNRAHGFIIDTHEAGVGEVKVRVGGPKGYFRIETEKRNRQLFCRYNPRYPGMYEIQVYWSGDPVPGSPFQVYLCDTEEELKEHLTMSALHHRDVQLHDFGHAFE